MFRSLKIRAFVLAMKGLDPALGLFFCTACAITTDAVFDVVDVGGDPADRGRTPSSRRWADWITREGGGAFSALQLYLAGGQTADGWGFLVHPHYRTLALMLMFAAAHALVYSMVVFSFQPSHLHNFVGPPRACCMWKWRGFRCFLRSWMAACLPRRTTLLRRPRWWVRTFVLWARECCTQRGVCMGSCGASSACRGRSPCAGRLICNNRRLFSSQLRVTLGYNLTPLKRDVGAQINQECWAEGVAAQAGIGNRQVADGSVGVMCCWYRSRMPHCGVAGRLQTQRHPFRLPEKWSLSGRSQCPNGRCCAAGAGPNWR